MAKRKRLNPTVMTSSPGADPAVLASSPAVGVPVGARAPIADVSRDATLQAAFDDVSQELRTAREDGRMVIVLPLDAIDVSHLVRDRVTLDADDMEELSESITVRGQQTPIEVVDLGNGRYGLISGWRRVSVLRTLFDQTGDPSFATAKALLRAPDGQADAYRAMVEENEIRASLSFYERARIAVKAKEQGAFETLHEAVQNLFAAARAPKRSKIMAFTGLVQHLDEDLKFPAAVPEKLGLALVAALQADAKVYDRLQKALIAAGPLTAEEERAVLDEMLRESASKSSARKPKARVPKPSAAKEISPGLLLETAKGRITLSGPGVDAAFQKKLKAWLAQE